MNVPREAICAAMAQIMEKMYFSEATWVGPGSLDSSVIGARVTVSGSLSGQFSVIATTSLAVQLAADFLGAEAGEMTVAQAAAIVHELANVACGATLGEWLPDAHFNISVPFGLSGADVQEQWDHRFCIAGPNADLAVDLALAP